MAVKVRLARFSEKEESLLRLIVIISGMAVLMDATALAEYTNSQQQGVW